MIFFPVVCERKSSIMKVLTFFLFLKSGSINLNHCHSLWWVHRINFTEPLIVIVYDLRLQPFFSWQENAGNEKTWINYISSVPGLCSPKQDLLLEVYNQILLLPSISEWIEKPIYPYNLIVLHIIKEQTADTYSNIDG